MDISYWREREIPGKTMNGPISTPSQKVWAYNHYVFKNKDRMLKTTFNTPSTLPSASIPDGLAVFSALETGLEQDAFKELLNGSES
jgi:hypothetical protein